MAIVKKTDKQDFENLSVGQVDPINAQELKAMESNSVKNLPASPVDSGLKAGVVQPKFYGFVLGSKNSFYAYFNDRMNKINMLTNEIVSSVNNELGIKLKAQLDSMIDDIDTAYSAINLNETNLNLEIENREKQGEDLYSKQAQEQTDREVADNTEALLRETKDKELENAIAQEVIDRNAKIDEVISQEVKDRNEAILTAINNLINGSAETLDTLKEIADWFSSQDEDIREQLTNGIADLKSELTGLINDVSLKLDTEIQDRKTAISNEEQARIDSDTQLREEFENALGTESSERESADRELELKLESEKEQRASSDELLQDNINDVKTEVKNYTDEKTAPLQPISIIFNGGATTVEGALLNLLNTISTVSGNATDISNSLSALQNSFTQALSTEQEARESKDSILETKINNEATSRANADSALQAKIDAINTILNTDISNYDTLQEIAEFLNTNQNAKDIMAHVNNNSNPHGVTKAQIGLGNVANTTDSDKIVHQLRVHHRATISLAFPTAYTWYDTGITTADVSTGLYAVRIYNDGQSANSIWSSHWCGLMMIYSGNVNTDAGEEVILHHSGHARNDRYIYLRVKPSQNSSSYSIQLACSIAIGTATNWEFNFYRIGE